MSYHYMLYTKNYSKLLPSLSNSGICGNVVIETYLRLKLNLTLPKTSKMSFVFLTRNCVFFGHPIELKYHEYRAKATIIKLLNISCEKNRRRLLNLKLRQKPR